MKKKTFLYVNQAKQKECFLTDMKGYHLIFIKKQDVKLFVALPKPKHFTDVFLLRIIQDQLRIFGGLNTETTTNPGLLSFQFLAFRAYLYLGTENILNSMFVAFFSFFSFLNHSRCGKQNSLKITHIIFLSQYLVGPADKLISVECLICFSHIYHICSFLSR